MLESCTKTKVVRKAWSRAAQRSAIRSFPAEPKRRLPSDSIQGPGSILAPILTLTLAVWGLFLAPQGLHGSPQFEEPLEKLEPRRAATEAEQDKADALVFFGMAREAESQGDTEQALRMFQRALRYDPTSLPAARAVVRLSIKLRRPDAGVYAALQISECADRDRPMLRYMALHLSRQGRWSEAVDLYERTLGGENSELQTPEDLLMMMEMARLRHLTGDSERAADDFARVLSALDDPENEERFAKTRKELLASEAETYQLVGSCFVAAGRLAEAESLFKKVEAASPDAARASLNTATIHFHAERYAEALEELETCLDRPSDSLGLRAYDLFEKTLDKLGRSDELIERLEELRGRQPDNTALKYFLAEKLFDSEKDAATEELYAELVEEAPTSTAYRRLLAIHLKHDRYDEALAVLAAVADKTGNLDSLEEALDELVESSAGVDGILAAAKKEPADAEEEQAGRFAAAGIVALAAGRFEAAGPLMEAALKGAPDRAGNLVLLWGVDLLAADRYAEAVRVLQKGLEVEGMGDEQRAVFLYYLAAARAMDGETDAALEAAREAVQLSEDTAPYHAREAWVLLQGEREQEAAKLYRDLIERFDDARDSEQARQAVRRARMVLSTICVESDRTEAAAEWLEQVLDEFPEDPGALNDLGYLWADEKLHLERALRMTRKAVEAEPDNGAYRDSLGWALFRNGRFEEAVAELEKAVELEPDPVVFDHLGDAYAKAGQAEKAVDAWRRSLEKFQESEQEDEAAAVRKKLDAAE